MPRKPAKPGDPPVTTVFAVVGEHRDDPGRLLLRGEDGRFYAYGRGGRLHAVAPDGAWVLDPDPADAGATDA